MSELYKSLSIAEPSDTSLDAIQKLTAAIAALGLAILFAAWADLAIINDSAFLYTSFALMTIGIAGFSWRTYMTQIPGIKNNGIWISSLTNRGLLAWISGIIITAFYVILYWFPMYLGLGQGEQANTSLVAFFDPLSMALKGSPASQWFVYGTLYTFGILIFGLRFIWKYRHNKYQILRTISVMFFQLGFAFLIPEFMQALNYPYNDMKNMWPLNYYFFDEYNIKALVGSGSVGLFMLILGVAMILVISPILTYLYGKRWYCSWVCGCGGLAETVGDPFRHLSDKSLRAWKIERWLIHSILLFSIIMTIGVVFSFTHNNPDGFWINKSWFVLIVLTLLGSALAIKRFRPNLLSGVDTKAQRIFAWFSGIVLLLMSISYLTGGYNAFFVDSHLLRGWYGFLIGAAFSGVVGVGFYPLMGSRVWCRFGCPMAAILGIQQKLFSRFRITTNGGQCISCGNCSTYCEMGIDVRSYAQKGQNIVRASCVGCGICAAVCPRGVLRLENGSKDLYARTIDIRNNHVKMDM